MSRDIYDTSYTMYCSGFNLGIIVSRIAINNTDSYSSFQSLNSSIRKEHIQQISIHKIS